MAFSFGSVAAASSGGAREGLRVQDGIELQEIQTDQLGFQAINGETKLRLLKNPWPSDDLPIPSASLMSVAASRGLLAAAGPDALIIVTTENVRQELQKEAGDKVRGISPLLSIPHNRISHVAFSADESVLVVSEHTHGGIVAYQVDKLKQGQAEPALKLSTNNVGLRALVPNPATPQYFAAITMNGDLILVDLAAGDLQKGANNDVILMNNISCLAWSNKGKQLVAGLADGTALQLKPDGSIVTRVPKSTSISDNVHVSGISWLENDSFMIIYTPNMTSTEDGIPPSEYFIVTRDKESYTFQKLPEILPPFGVERIPTHHFISRFRKWAPHLEDLLILSATTATDVGIVSKADRPLSSEEPVVNAFTFTTIDNDARRGALPLSIEESLDTSPIGMVIDLSSKQTIPRPIPADEEILETSGPVPNLMVLNNEGILCSWWIIYNDSVREKTTFSGFTTLTAMEETRSETSPLVTNGDTPAHENTTATSPKVLPGTALPFAKPSSSFGSILKQPTFGTGAGFGPGSKIGESKGSWTSTGFGNTTTTPTGVSQFGKSGSGQSAFGTPSAPGSNNVPAFGTTAALGNQSNPFGQMSSTAPAFGQTTFGSNPATSKTFGSATTASPFSSTSGTSGFASFSGGSGFAALNEKTNKESPFANSSGNSAFGQSSFANSPFTKAGGGNVFEKLSGPSSFGKGQAFGSASSESRPIFGNTNDFKLGSTFKGDGSAKDDLPKPISGTGFGFSSGFGDLLGDSEPVLSPTRDTETVMEDKSDNQSEPADARDTSFSEIHRDQQDGRSETVKSLVTPPSTIQQSKATPAQPVSNLFGTAQDQHKTPDPPGSAWTFGKVTSTTPKETPAAAKTLFGTKTMSGFPAADAQRSESVNTFAAIKEAKTPEMKLNARRNSGPKITTQSPSDDEAVENEQIPEAPLPPDTTSKPGYQTGDTSASSIQSSKPDDAPLPPDLLSTRSSAQAGLVPELPTQDDENDNEEFSSDFEDSGEDVTHDISPADGSESQHDQQEDDDNLDDDHEITDQIDTSPESLHKAESIINATDSPTGGLFTKVTVNQSTKPSRPLFGEVGGTAPVFPPPKPQESPRSPSPIRQLMPHDSLRTEARSVSAPARPRSAIEQRKAEYSQSAIAEQAARAREEELNKERARLAALKQTQELARAEELRYLEDDEDARIQKELAEPISPSETLDAFITYEAVSEVSTGKVDIPAQIERLYQDINSMICTLGINARSLASFLAYQKTHQPNQTWPAVLHSVTPLDAMNDEWFFEDIELLYDGSLVLEENLQRSSFDEIQRKLEACQGPLSQDIQELKAKIKALRKAVSAKSDDKSPTAPLSAEQASIQNDLRKASADVQTKLVNVEDNLSMLRARLADVASPEPSTKGNSALGSAQSKKPTVEAVSNTVAKMTSMAEKKSADVDVLEAQLKRMGFANEAIAGHQTLQPSTPRRNGQLRATATPSSATSSVYHTPGSQLAGSRQGTPLSVDSAKKANAIGMISLDDRQRWQVKVKRRKDVAKALRSILEEKRARFEAQAQK